ncbi:MAG: hypothetical protein LBC73_10105 [Oscillospiraceae bacterium]|jgi:hypothetical protein|nr:hypothetical protein [Oscillospiraceae bacterium]
MSVGVQNSVKNEAVFVFTALDFLSTFFSVLKKENVNIVSAAKLFESIGRHRESYLPIFIDIDVINNGGTIYSHDLEEGLSMLQIIGAVGKANPKFERIILKMHKEEADVFIDDCPEPYRNYVINFANEYLKETKES